MAATALTCTTRTAFAARPQWRPASPFITEYLERLLETTQLALSDHLQVFAVVFDLRFADDTYRHSIICERMFGSSLPVSTSGKTANESPDVLEYALTT